MTPLDLQAGAAKPAEAGAQPRRLSEQSLIRELYSSVWEIVEFYGSQIATARALGISAPTLNRLVNCPGRLPRPQRATLLAFSRCDHERVRQAADALLKHRGYSNIV